MSTERGKEIHYLSMRIMGYMTVAISLWAAWVAFGGGRGLPSWMYGRLSASAAPVQPAVRKPARCLVGWNRWDRDTLARARSKDKLLLLHLAAPWSRSSRVMEETTYADPALAAFIEERFVPVRADADERPDLALRYLGHGCPTTALLLPTGELLAGGSFMTPELLRAWAEPIDKAFRRRRQDVADAALMAMSRRLESAAPSSAPAPRAVEALAWAKDQVMAEWDAGSLGFGRGARFPRFSWVRDLQDLPGQDWAESLSREAAEGAKNLEDPVWGGFYRGAAGPGWARPEFDKRLEDQAEAVMALERLDPGAAERALRYVSAFLTDPAGGYFASQAGEVRRKDGRVVEGSYYFAEDDRRRRALGLPDADRRLFASANALMARAVLSSALPAARRARSGAIKALERFTPSSSGAAPHRPGGEAGLLADQIALGRAWLAAKAAGDSRGLGRALAFWGYSDAKLSQVGSGALYDRPRRGELPEGLDRVLSAELNLEAFRFLRELAEALPPRDARRAPLEARAAALRAWLLSRAKELDPLSLLDLTRAG